MRQMLKSSLILLALAAMAVSSPLCAQPQEKRIALVIGNANYSVKPLATSANDAGLVAQTLQAAGFDVAGAGDLDEDSLRRAFRDFIDKAQASGPDTVAFVYLSGYGAQLEGENYFVPVDAKIVTASDVAVEALRISDYTKRLAGLPLKASFIVLDTARDSPFAKSGPPLAGGLALTDAAPNTLVAFNAAPGTVAPYESGPYGAYARALVEMIREGGLSPSEVFDGVRLRVNEETKGAEVPWNVSRIETSFVFFERAADAPPPALAADRANALQSQPLRNLGAQDAYAAAIERDTLQGYEEFLATYPSDPLASRVRALLAARREAMTWQRTYEVNTPAAYWSYLNRYPGGPHAADAHRRLAALAATADPPPSFAPIAYNVPPPPPQEIEYVDRPVLVLNNPLFGFVPPPPIVFLAPPPVYLVFPPPLLPVGLFLLPFPSVFIPLPLWCNPPFFVAPPVNNFIFNNIHNTVIVNNTTKTVTVKDHNGKVLSTSPINAAGASARALGAALPPSVAKKAERAQPAGAAAHYPSGETAAPGKESLGHPLPGMGGHALPPIPGKAAGAQPPAGASKAKPPAISAPASTLGNREPPPHAQPQQPKRLTPTGGLAASHQAQQRVAHARSRPARAVHAPVRHAPAYHPPVRRTPTYHPPVHRAPAFRAPAFRAPPRAAPRRR